MPDRILTYRTATRIISSEYRGLDYRGFLSKQRVVRGIEPLALPPDDAVEGEVPAYISAGRWVMDCLVCVTGFLVDDEDLLFYCPGCGTDGRWQRVVMPDDRLEIERLLLLRPGWQANAPSRNWLVHETVEDLRSDNLAHGVEV